MNFTYDQKRLTELMNDFYSLTKIKTAIYDNNFNSILEVPKEDSAFCSAIQKNAIGRNQCNLCTKMQYKRLEGQIPLQSIRVMRG